MALAVRGIIKLPTGNEDAGVSTGKTDVMADLIGSKEIARVFEVATFVGYEIRGNPDGIDAPTGSYRWGTGVAFPSRSPLRLSAEVNGDLPTSYRATLTDDSVVGDDGSVRPFESDIRNRTRATGGLTYQMPAGFYMGTGLSWNAPRYWDWQVRIGYHGRGRMQARSLPSASASPAARVTPAIELPGPAATPEPPRAAVVTAPPPVVENQPPQTIAAAKDYTFDDVYFDLDGFTPRAEATAVLDEAAQAMLANATLTLNIEGHTCDIGTAEYNMALATAAPMRSGITSSAAASPRAGCAPRATARKIPSMRTCTKTRAVSIDVSRWSSGCSRNRSIEHETIADSGTRRCDGRCRVRDDRRGRHRLAARIRERRRGRPRFTTRGCEHCCTAPRPVYRDMTIPAGTTLPLSLTSSMASDTSAVEDTVTAELTRAITIDGFDVLPAGAAVNGHVTEVDGSGRVKGRARIAFRFTSLRTAEERYDVQSSPLSHLAPATKGEDAAKIGVGAGAGAIIGGILGGKDGAAKGAAVGGAAGTGVVLATKGQEMRLGPGADVSTQLTAPLTVRVRVS